MEQANCQTNSRLTSNVSSGCIVVKAGEWAYDFYTIFILSFLLCFLLLLLLLFFPQADDDSRVSLTEIALTPGEFDGYQVSAGCALTFCLKELRVSSRSVCMVNQM